MTAISAKKCGTVAILLLIGTCFECISAVKDELIYGGDSYTAHASGNKTVVFEWTLNDASSHIIRCAVDSSDTTDPTLTWWRLVSHIVSTEPVQVDYVLSQDMNISNAVVDTSNAKDIGITFSHISYDQIGDYFCISTSNDSSSTNVTNYRVRISEHRSRGVVATWTILTMLFVGGAFLICRRFRLNDFSTRIDL